MKISIIGGGNMGSAIAIGLSAGNTIKKSDITIIDHNPSKIENIKKSAPQINALVNDYTSINQADIILFAVKPWIMEETIKAHKAAMNPRQIIISIAAGIPLQSLSKWALPEAPIYIAMPNTAIAIRQSMTFLVPHNTTDKQNNDILQIFSDLGQAMLIEEKLLPATMSLSSCGIAYALRYIRAAMEGGIEMGIKANDSKDILVQTLRGAIELLEVNHSHPEAEIDKVTTPGGITIKGLNEMEHAGFTSAVIRGLKASYIK